MNFRKIFRNRSRNRRAVAMERRQWLLGAMITLVVAFIWWNGLLDRFEYMTQDQRQQFFYSQSDSPAEEVALIAVDDRALDTVGRWPWDREKLAQIIDELRRARARVVALDILLNEPQEPRFVQQPNPLQWEVHTERQVTEDEKKSPLVRVDDDRLLERAIYQHAKVILATKFPPAEGEQAVASASKIPLDPVFQSLERDTKVQEALKRMEEVPAEWRGSLDASKKEEFDRVETDALAALREAIQGKNRTGATRGHELDEMRRVLDRVLAVKTSTDSCAVKLKIGGRAWAKSVDPNPPIAMLAASAARLSNVSFDSIDADGKTRRIPLWMQHRAALWPTLGLAAFMEYKGLQPEDVLIEGSAIVFRNRDGEKRFGMMKNRLRRGTEVDGLTAITWPRGSYGMAERVRRDVELARKRFESTPDQLELVFARPPAEMRGWEWQLFNTGEARTQIVAAGRLYEPVLQAARIRENIIVMAGLLEKSAGRTMLQLIKPEERDRARVLVRQLLRLAPGDKGELIAFETDDPEWLGALDQLRAFANKAVREGRDFLDEVVSLLLEVARKSEKDARGLMGDAPFEPFAAALAKGDKEAKEFMLGAPEIWTKANLKKLELKDDDVDMFEAASSATLGLPLAMDQINESITTIARIRYQMQNLLSGKIAIMGFTALATDSDVVNTPIDSKTPGVMVHVAVVNSLLKELSRLPWPVGADFFVIAFMGILGTWLGVRFSVFTGPLALAALVLGWFLISGAYFWDNRMVTTAVAGPSVAAVAGWVTVLLHRLLVEQRGRKVTEERFKSYVSPAVVDILVNNPELGTMKPSMREMTVMFTDVADFTTTSERLGPELLAKCLSKYLKEMTEILQKNRGTLDKYLGDGIMAFYNAPIDDPEHARHACATAVAMLARLDELNDVGAFEEAGRLKVRIGICTGQCMVGDFGNPPRNSNYTLLGDTANFAARLEGANKFFGSRILATQRTRDHAGPDVRWRTIGKVFVKGKKEADWLYELVGRLEPHGPATEEWMNLTDEAVKDYAAGNFDECTRKFDMLARRFGDSKLAEIYGDAMAAWKTRPDFPAAFDGAIVLTEK